MNKMNVLHNTYVETVSLSCKFVYIHGQCSVSCWENVALMVWLGFGHKNLNVGVRKGSCFIATNWGPVESIQWFHACDAETLSRGRLVLDSHLAATIAELSRHHRPLYLLTWQSAHGHVYIQI